MNMSPINSLNFARPGRLRGAAQSRLSHHFGRRLAQMRPDVGPMLCLSFDDVPLSACTEGAELLARFDARATFYVSGGLRQTDQGAPCAGPEDLRAMLDAGHEIGCHGFGHLDYQRLGPVAVTADLDRNAAYFRDAGLPQARSFAFPFGRATLAAKRICAERFQSSRGVHRGDYAGPADLAYLPADPFYSRWLDDAGIIASIDALERSRGMLALLTHGVSDRPGPYDCTPAHLALLLETARLRGIPVLPTGEVMTFLYESAE